MNTRSIYLHIFDREFRSFTNSKLSDEDACTTVLIASLLSSSPYAGMANLMESQPDLPKAVELFCELESIREAVIVSSTNYPDEFIEGRRKLYYDDKDRYPMYFESGKGLLLPKYSVPLHDSTTTILEDKLLKELREENAPRHLKKAADIRNAILNRDESGITIGIVRKHTTLEPYDYRWLGQQISRTYTGRYMAVLDGALIKGIPNVSTVVDDLSKAYYYYDLYNSFFSNTVLRHINREERTGSIVEQLALLKQREGYWDMVDYYNDIVKSLVSQFTKDNVPGSEQFAALRCFDFVKKYIFQALAMPKEFNAQQNLFLLRAAVQKIKEKEKIEIIMGQDNNIKKLLYLVATDTEYDKVFEYYKQKNGYTPKGFVIGDYTYRDLGIIGCTHVYLLKTKMGAKGIGGSIKVVSEAANSLKPDYMIMVGIGFGLKEEEQKIGDIMVASAIEDYGTFKQKEGVTIQRGDRIQSNPILMNRFADSKLEWEKSAVHTGLILTNDILVNDKELVKYLQQNYPDAIGGEMEGCGLLANYNEKWILVKAICDFGHDKSNDHQVDAARNAIEYVDMTLEKYSL